MACGFLENVISNSFGTLLSVWVLEPVRRQFRYVSSFDDYVEKLTAKKGDLAAERDRLHHEKQEAERQLQRIEDGVQNLLSDVEKILTDTELENDMQQNKKCFIWCPNWWGRYRLSKKLAKKTLVITELLGKTAKFGQPGRVGYHDPSVFQNPEFWKSDFKFSESSKAAFDQIIEALKDDNVSMIGLQGMGGVGKTTLVREVARQALSKLFDKVVVVPVSQKPNFERISDEIAKGLSSGDEDKDKDKDVKRTSKQKLWLKLLAEKSVLIVLDDVWTKIDLKEEIGISVGEAHKGCKVLLTTRRRWVCSSMDCREVRLACLGEEDAWALFENKAGLRNCSDDAVRKVAKEVAKRCDGLPIAIVTLGSALKGKKVAEWSSASRRLKKHGLMDIPDIDQEQGNKNAYLCIEMSFDYLRERETKICFLLCSLFPEDYEIDVEDLVRYAWGLQLYRGTDTIEDMRIEVQAAIEFLKDSCLLLDCGENLVNMRGPFVKMHDVVRSFALQIASNKKEISFKVLFDEFEKWPMDESFECCTAMSLKANRINELPEGLVWPDLKILLLGVGEKHVDVGSSISGAFFEGMKALKACSLPPGFSSPHAFYSLTNLRNLNLRWDPRIFMDLGQRRNWVRRNTLDISSLGKLKGLQILNLEGLISELPSEIGELSNLRLLDLSKCEGLKRIPPNLIRRLSKLEELHLTWTHMKWATSETGEEESNVSLLELNSLPNLAAISLMISPEHLPIDFVFPKLERYDISIIGRVYCRRDFFASRSLKVESSSSLDACKELFENLESLILKSVAVYTNLVPSFVLDEGRSNQLISLILERCKDMKCLIDTTLMQQKATTFTALSNLKELRLDGMDGLEELCKGHQPQGFLQNLKILSIRECKNIISGIPFLENLEELIVEYCDEMQMLFQGSPEPKSFQSLKEVNIWGCKKLTYLFPTSVAKSLCQLEKLSISELAGVDQIIQETEESNICLQSLREVSVHQCHNLTSLSSLSHGQILENLRTLEVYGGSKLEFVFPISMAERLPQLKVVDLGNLPQLKGNGRETVFTLPSLQDLHVTNCPQLTPFIISAKLKGLWLHGMTERKQLHNNIVVQPESGRTSPNMEYLTITNFEELFDGDYNLSSLEKLDLYQLPELRVVWKDPIQVVNFQSLAELEVHDCRRLRYIFSTTIAPNFPQLSSLRISRCEELEQIIENDQTSSLRLQPICFPNLTRIIIQNCRKLKSLFPVSVADGLPKLEEIELISVSQLEQVFELGDEANVSQNEERVVQLHQLRSLHLSKLPSLVSFTSVGYHFVLPSLGDLRVERCPKVATRFSVDSKQSGHAITEIEDDDDLIIPSYFFEHEGVETTDEDDFIIPPYFFEPAARSIDQDIVEGSSTAQETTWPIGSDIRWFRRR